MPKSKKQNKSDLQFDLFSETEIQSTASPESKESPSQRKEDLDTSVAIFEKEEFGTVRTIEVDGKILFCGKDVASILGYTNKTKALNDHCKTDGVTNRYPIIDSLGRTQEARFITEGDVYRLIAHSKLKSAQKFESWIFDEVLPSIRKTGRYDIREKESYNEIRNKSKKTRLQFTETLKEHGYSKPHEYIQTTKQMKQSLGITVKKDQMTEKQLKAIAASEALSDLLLTDEFGFKQVNPVCLEATKTVSALANKKNVFALEVNHIAG